jgi:hypothetical protein
MSDPTKYHLYRVYATDPRDPFAQNCQILVEKRLIRGDDPSKVWWRKRLVVERIKQIIGDFPRMSFWEEYSFNSTVIAITTTITIEDFAVSHPEVYLLCKQQRHQFFF